MNIAVVAQDTKKKLLMRLCMAYQSVLNRHRLYSTVGVGNLVSQSTGLRISILYGGIQQISARVSCGELDLLLFFRDGMNSGFENIENEMLRLCDVHMIPYATNVATAEVLIHGLKRGDLEWRSNLGAPFVNINDDNIETVDWKSVNIIQGA
ncbi:MAG: methylglyoxal synthase [Candidatus Paraimprobicoccus trichonymphae]|uniref:Methylglyoxal synthase n=1 Tax=Candidatus Paraimprobicoccus trichonymphae TaxID=3033793 RepID=A0AA48IH90_9FIRM|nr:MAG: methylglyoxal synthase [Candidatus Paraimprobicoccus trichonymphae]